MVFKESRLNSINVFSARSGCVNLVLEVNRYYSMERAFADALMEVMGRVSAKDYLKQDF